MEPEVEEDGRVKKKTDGNGTGPRSGYRAPRGHKRAHGPGWIRIPQWTSPAKLHCNLLRVTFMGFMDSNFYPDATQEIPHLQHDSPHIEAEQPSAR